MDKTKQIPVDIEEQRHDEAHSHLCVLCNYINITQIF